MAWRKGSAFRTDPGSGQRIRVNTFVDPVDYQAVVQETILQSSAPLCWVQVGAAEATDARDYPYSGGAPASFSAISASAATDLWLATGAMDGGSSIYQGANALDPTGVAVVVLDGNAKGDVRRITGWHAGSPTSTSKRVDFAIPLSNNVATSNKYALAYLSIHDSYLVIHPEFSTQTSTGAQIVVVLSDFSVLDSGVQRAPRRAATALLDVFNLGFSIDGGAGFQGQLISVPLLGAVTASVYVVKKPSAGTMDLWVSSV